MPLRRAALVALLILGVARPLPAQEGAAPAPAPSSPGAQATPPGAASPAGQTGPAGQAAARLDTILPRRCGLCHLDKAPAAPGGIITFAPPARSSAPGDSEMCYSCHNGIVDDGRRAHWTGRHHPASGRVSCGSCHTPHVREANVGPFMRYPKGSFGYCGSCHTGRRAGELGEHPAVAQEKGRAQDCGSCHVVHGATSDGLIRSASAEALCGSCHGENPSRAGRGPGLLSHPSGKKGPPCLGCHRVHKTFGGKALLDKAAFDGRLCVQCHEKSLSAQRSGENHPVSQGGATCLGCHRMHNAEKQGSRRGLLAGSWGDTDGLCRPCHGALLASPGAGGTWNHPVGGSVAKDERSLGVRLGRSGAFFAQGGKMTCLSCHRSHGGRAGTPQLVTAREALCLYCHPAENSLDPQQAALGAHPVSVRPRLARIDAAFLNAGGVTGQNGELTCGTCHRAHAGQPGTPGLVLPRESYSCLLCHSREASIASSVHSSARVPGSTRGPGAAGLCGGCHGEHGWRIPLGDQAAGGTAVERICGACHGAKEEGSPLATNHPLGVSPAPGRGSGGLPLYWSDGRRFRQGVITCATCHDPHQPGRGGRFLRSGITGLTRELCLGCHAAEGAVVGTRHDLSAAQGSTCGPCHVVHDALGVASWPAARGGERSGADLGDFCTNCHSAEGAAASAIVAERTHPSPARKGGKTVGCGGCHDPHRWNPDNAADRGAAGPGGAAGVGDAGAMFLVRPAAGPADLCAGCHADQAVVVGTPHDLTARAARRLPAGVRDPRRHGVCGVCHSVHGPQPLPVTFTPPEPGKPGAKPVAGPDPCEQCHAAGKIASGSTVGERSHPVGMFAGQDFGPDLPLFGFDGRRQSGARITCATCHNAHRWEPPGGSGGTSKAATSFLRAGADGYAPLCFPCHAEKSMVVGTDHDLRVTAPRAVNLGGEDAEQSGVCGACHAVHHAPEGLALRNRAPGEGPDEHSRACTGCHRPDNDQGARVPPRSEAHFVNFPGKGLIRRVLGPPRGISAAPEAAIPLFGEDGAPADQGYLSCASCHDVHRWEGDVSNSGSGVPVEGDASNSFLRVPAAKLDRTLCADCHATSLVEHYRTYHFPEGK